MVEILDNHKVGGTIRVLSTDVDKVDGSSGFCGRMEGIKSWPSKPESAGYLKFFS